MLLNYYPVKTREELQAYLDAYMQIVLNVADSFAINLATANFVGDHLGLQVLSGEEFDETHKLLSNYSTMVKDSVIHDRRNRVYKFLSPLQTVSGVTFAGIETFEPKPTADLKKLKPGIEHCAFKVLDYDNFYADAQSRNIPIDKSVEMDGSKFFKTSFVNLVEIEFRNDFL